MLLKLYLYCDRNKICSSRKLEKESSRNIELKWLLQNLQSKYHYRLPQAACKVLQSKFKLYVQFLSDAGLLGKTTIGIDGSKLKANINKKNNYNQKKIDKHRQFIEDKTTQYLQELDEIDKN